MRIEHPGLIIGSRKIATFLHISRATLYRWIKRYGFNVVHLPDGRLAYTPELLHVWLLARQRVARQATEAQTDGEEEDGAAKSAP